jgi:hypothetical protein
MVEALTCLTRLFKMEEENGLETNPELKSLLLAMESSELPQ